MRGCARRIPDLVPGKLRSVSTYSVISDAAGVPEMADLDVAYINEPGGREGGYIAFSNDFGRDPITYEPAVGRRCRVVRESDAGVRQECGGAVERISPVRVALDGGGWK